MFMYMPNGSEEILKVPKSKQERVVESLIAKSRPSSPYNLLLVFSALIVASGMIIDSVAVIIGGMLVTPLLSPILAIVLGISTGEVGLVNRSLWITLRSILVIVVISAITGFLFSESIDGKEFINSIEPSILYVLVAGVSGIAASFAWTNDEINAALPGVAVAISIVPPLSAFGIGISHLSLDIIRSSSVVFILNFLGIIAGSLLVFSLQQFYRAKKVAHKEVIEEKNNKN